MGVALEQFRKLGSALARHTGQEEGEKVGHLVKRVAILLQRGLSSMLLNRIPGHPPVDSLPLVLPSPCSPSSAFELSPCPPAPSPSGEYETVAQPRSPSPSSTWPPCGQAPPCQRCALDSPC